MPEHPSLAVYTLTVLARLLTDCRTLAEIEQAIRAYPEDLRREGPVRAAMSQFVSTFPTFDELSREVQSRVASHGGQGELDALQEHMEFDEFMGGWDEEE